MKVLLIEDEVHLSNSIKEYLKAEKYICETCFTFQSAIEKIKLYPYDCIIVDIMLPDGSGINIVKDLKAHNNSAGIIIISAKNSIENKVEGLEIGADDYLSKPFHLSELNARVKAVIRRKVFSGKNEIIFNEIMIMPSYTRVLVNNSELVLTKKEYDLLLFLIANKDRIITKESFAEHLWGDGIDTADSFDFIYSHIKNLRRKIISLGGKDYIKTVYGIGYKLISEL